MEKQEISWAEIRDMQAENSRQMAELRSSIADTNRSLAETHALFDKLGIGIEGARTELSGISKSNGMFAEEYFYNALKKKLTFAGIHFDDADNTLHGRKKRRGYPEVQDQFDIVLTNIEVAAIIEVKYRARTVDVEVLAESSAKNLRFLFPEYKDLRIYLGVAAMTFDEGVVKAAQKHGVGIIRQVGETVEEEGAWEVWAR